MILHPLNEVKVGTYKASEGYAAAFFRRGHRRLLFWLSSLKLQALTLLHISDCHLLLLSLLFELSLEICQLLLQGVTLSLGCCDGNLLLLFGLEFFFLGLC